VRGTTAPGVHRCRVTDLDQEGLDVEQEVGVNAWSFRDHPPHVVSADPGGRTLALHDDSARGLVGAEQDRRADHSLAPDDADLGGFVRRRFGYDGRKATLDEPDVLDGLVWFDQHLAKLQRNALEMRMEEVQFLQCQACQKSVAGDGLRQMRHRSSLFGARARSVSQPSAP
jgi:hypothetical protein